MGVCEESSTAEINRQIPARQYHSFLNSSLQGMARERDSAMKTMQGIITHVE